MRLFFRIAVIILLMSQFTLATHAYEHDIHDTDAHQCQVCLKLSSINHVHISTIPDLSLRELLDESIIITSIFYTETYHLDTSIRSPPNT